MGRVSIRDGMGRVPATVRRDPESRDRLGWALVLLAAVCAVLLWGM